MGKGNTLTALALGTSLAFTSACRDSERENRAQKMNRQQPIYEITHSVERDNINKRLELANDPTQIMWIYCLSDMGNIIVNSPVVGKVSSSDKRLEPKVTVSTPYKTSSSRSWDEMGADGTYGSSDPYVYWFTPEGQYFQWNGDYVVSNVPLKIDRALFNVRDINFEELQRAKIAEKALKAGKKVNNNLEVEEVE